MRINKRLKAIHEAIDVCRLDFDEIKENPALDPDNADWIGGVHVIQQKRTHAEHKSYEKFYNAVVNAAGLPKV